MLHAMALNDLAYEAVIERLFETLFERGNVNSVH